MKIDLQYLPESPDNRVRHTPGPWFAIQYANQWCIQSEEGYEGANSDVLDEEFTDKAEANAHLIAAAPDLLAALEVLKAWVGKLSDWAGQDPPCEIVDAAIIKATGGTA